MKELFFTKTLDNLTFKKPTLKIKEYDFMRWLSLKPTLKRVLSDGVVKCRHKRCVARTTIFTSVLKNQIRLLF